MATGYEVEPAQLSALAKELGRAVDTMGSARQQMHAAGDRQTGEASLDHACGDFRDKWGYGLKMLAETTHALAGGLDATAKAYLAVEQALAAAFGAAGGAGGGALGGAGGGGGGSGGGGTTFGGHPPRGPINGTLDGGEPVGIGGGTHHGPIENPGPLAANGNGGRA